MIDLTYDNRNLRLNTHQPLRFHFFDKIGTQGFIQDPESPYDGTLYVYNCQLQPTAYIFAAIFDLLTDYELGFISLTMRDDKISAFQQSLNILCESSGGIKTGQFIL